MQIILKVKTQFFQYAKTGVKHILDGGEIIAVQNSVVVNPSYKPQTVPDWIDADPLFALMVKDGTLIQVQTVETPTQDSGKTK